MPSDFPSQALDKFNVRLPAGMRKKIGQAARVNKRTMNQEIVSYIERCLAGDQKNEEKGGSEVSIALLLEIHEMVSAVYQAVKKPQPLSLPLPEDVIEAISREVARALRNAGRLPPSDAAIDSAAEPPPSDKVQVRPKSWMAKLAAAAKAKE